MSKDKEGWKQKIIPLLICLALMAAFFMVGSGGHNLKCDHCGEALKVKWFSNPFSDRGKFHLPCWKEWSKKNDSEPMPPKHEPPKHDPPKHEPPEVEDKVIDPPPFIHSPPPKKRQRNQVRDPLLDPSPTYKD